MRLLDSFDFKVSNQLLFQYITVPRETLVGCGDRAVELGSAPLPVALNSRDGV
jgi:hypothetical protein